MTNRHTQKSLNSDSHTDTQKSTKTYNPTVTWYRDWEKLESPAYEKLSKFKATDRSFVTMRTGRDNQMYNLTEGFNLKKFDQGFSRTTRKGRQNSEFDAFLAYRLAEKKVQYKQFKKMQDD